MIIKNLHKWQVDFREARKIQIDLAGKIILKNEFDQLNIIAGCDVAYTSSDNRAYAAICLYEYPSITKKEEVLSISEVSYPYITGLFTFREGPPLLRAFEKLKKRPDVIIFNGQGIAHPRKMGLATHLGILLDIPSIGCTQRSMLGPEIEPGNHHGDRCEVRNPSNEKIGSWLRTRENVRPIFVSQGHKINLSTGIDIILNCTKNYKMPEPLRAAHIAANHLKAIDRAKKNGN
jgi:deoxyribonuclease V